MGKFKVQNYVRIIAGSFILISSILTYLISVNWLLLGIFVGLNLFQFGFTNFCPLGYFLKKLGIEE